MNSPAKSQKSNRFFDSQHQSPAKNGYNQDFTNNDMSFFTSPRNKKDVKNQYNVLIDIPLIIREKDISERKETINIFKKKRLQGSQGLQKVQPSKSIKSKKAADKIGRIFINELWSEKFHKQVLKESKIQEIVERINKMQRNNLTSIIENVNEDISKLEEQNRTLQNFVMSDNTLYPQHLMQKHLANESYIQPFSKEYQLYQQNFQTLQQLQKSQFQRGKQFKNNNNNNNTSINGYNTTQNGNSFNSFFSSNINENSVKNDLVNQTVGNSRFKYKSQYDSPRLSRKNIQSSKFANSSQFKLQQPSSTKNINRKYINLNDSLSDDGEIKEGQKNQKINYYFNQKEKKKNLLQVKQNKFKISSIIDDCKKIVNEGGEIFQDRWLDKNCVQDYRPGISKIEHDKYSFKCGCCNKELPNEQYHNHAMQTRFKIYLRKQKKLQESSSPQMNQSQSYSYKNSISKLPPLNI